MRLINKFAALLIVTIALIGCTVESEFTEVEVGTTSVYTLTPSASIPVYKYDIYHELDPVQVLTWRNSTEIKSLNEIEEWVDETDRTDPDNPIIKFSYREIQLNDNIVQGENLGTKEEIYHVRYDGSTKSLKMTLVQVDGVVVNNSAETYSWCASAEGEKLY